MAEQSPPSRLPERAVIVTGAAKRVGAVVAEALGAAGWFVHVHYRNSAAEAEAVVAKVTAAGGAAATVSYDLEKLDARIGPLARESPQALHEQPRWEEDLDRDPDFGFPALRELPRRVLEACGLVDQRLAAAIEDLAGGCEDRFAAADLEHLDPEQLLQPLDRIGERGLTFVQSLAGSRVAA